MSLRRTAAMPCASWLWAKAGLFFAAVCPTFLSERHIPCPCFQQGNRRQPMHEPTARIASQCQNAEWALLHALTSPLRVAAVAGIQ